ncbi:hypothetical protein ACWJJH_02780 [Endozoicomonadaceae bacterium StTr2]
MAVSGSGAIPPPSSSMPALSPQALLTDCSVLGKLPLRPPQHILPTPLDSGSYRAGSCFMLGNHALQQGFWALARSCYISCLHRHLERPALHYNLALCELATGRYRQASMRLNRALLLAPGHPDIQQRLVDLAVMEQQHKAVDWYYPVTTLNRELLLEPLQLRHLPFVTEPFQLPATAARIQIPLQSGESGVREWWRQRLNNGNRRLLAAMHRDLGFSGLSQVSVHRQDGWCVFWLGQDGLHPELAFQVIRLTVRMMQTRGLERLYTAVYPDSRISWRALERAGFVRLGQQLPDHKPRVWFYGRKLTQSAGKVLDQQSLRQFLQQATVAGDVL